MASKKQIAANRRNSKKSTGPTTAQGKQIARMNALKHGLRAENVLLPDEDPEEFEAMCQSLEEHYQPVGPAERIQFERIVECTWRVQRFGLFETAIMRKNHATMALESAKGARDRAKEELRGVEDEFFDCFRFPPNDDEDLEVESDQTDTNDSDKTYTILDRNFEKAERNHRRISEESENEFRSSMGFLAVIFSRSINDLEKLSRYETCMTRRLDSAIQNLERLQTSRKRAKLQAGKVIDVADIN